MGRVINASSLCLDCKRKGEQERMLKRKVSTHVRISHMKSQRYKKKKKKKKKGNKAKLDVTYSSFSSKHKMRGCLSLTALCPVGRGSICRWPWSSRFGLACRLKLSRTFLNWYRNICHFNSLFPT